MPVLNIPPPRSATCCLLQRSPFPSPPKIQARLNHVFLAHVVIRFPTPRGPRGLLGSCLSLARTWPTFFLSIFRANDMTNWTQFLFFFFDHPPRTCFLFPTPSYGAPNLWCAGISSNRRPGPCFPSSNWDPPQVFPCCTFSSIRECRPHPEHFKQVAVQPSLILCLIV